MKKKVKKKEKKKKIIRATLAPQVHVLLPGNAKVLIIFVSL